jgi:hypothetical protein
MGGKSCVANFAEGFLEKALVIGALALDFSTHPFLLAEVISNAAEKFPLYDDMFKAITLGEGAPWSFLEKGQCMSPPPSPDERAQVQLGRCRYGSDILE